MRIGKKLLFYIIWSLLPLWLLAQVDTTSASYKIGYKIGTWLPFIILASLFIYMAVKAARRSREQD